MTLELPEPEPPIPEDEEAKKEAQRAHLVGKLARDPGLRNASRALVAAVRVTAKKFVKNPDPRALYLAAETLVESAHQEWERSLPKID